METPAEKPHACPACHGFDFCFWAKLLVAIPALPMIGLFAATQFESQLGQAIAFIAAILLTVWAAIKIDRLPFLQKKVIKGKCEDVLHGD